MAALVVAEDSVVSGVVHCLDNVYNKLVSAWKKLIHTHVTPDKYTFGSLNRLVSEDSKQLKC